MVKDIQCSLNMYEAKRQTHSDSTAISIWLYITQRYQLKIHRSQGGVETVVEDMVSPQQFYAQVKIPLFVTGLRYARHNYLSRELSKLNLDPTVCEFFKEQIESWIFGEVGKSRCSFEEGFEIVAQLHVFKTESVDKEEFDRHSCQIHGIEISDLLNWNPALESLF